MFKKRIVVKVGTNVMTNRNNRIVGPILKNLVRQIAYLYERDIITILVSSGSAIAGKEVLGRSDEENPSVRRQIYSSVGQPRMMRHYYTMFHDYGMRCAQVLATKRDFAPGKYRQNMINCYEGLLKEGIIPIANEDDAVSLSMSMFTDNDELASLVADLVNADTMIMLTDIDGLYTGHPKHDSSKLLNEVKVHENVEKYVQESEKGEGEGRGGMESKLRIAKETACKNIPTYIANGKDEDIILDILNGKKVGTKFSV
ncbi:glutamate 5-kinase [Mesohalobacter halotolerans]|jgi:glutamate 5-kinase|uniref:Glutamate 5-kinase n=1 Tax=Mesohalobacter halotolerans TaxID=1883405 RepID=A0A4U5TPG6_9FLAO|nr:glutamate 5-kinase [Mesohalobacter halotolerans]MBS3739127.1 glutamate 5-kinase [Psychroflexus sp.]NBC59086.1 glutamate 5-kinase [Bacteroidota bacterium]TKS55863.1 glutamate 5-kinase [Mesohalobacter halotolerans]